MGGQEGPSAAAPTPLLGSSEVVVDRQLGVGGFCAVWAVRRFEVELPDQEDPNDEGQVSRRRLAKCFRTYEDKHFSYMHVPGQPLPPTDPAEQRPPKVALKRVKPGLGAARYETGVRDLTAEVRVLARCSHPNIISLYAIGRDDAVVNDGGSRGVSFAVIGQLRATLKNKLYKWREDRGMGIFISRRALNELWLERLVVLKSVADALRYLHSRGIVHRDITPDNVGFDGEEVVKLFDFGLARFLNDEVGAATVSDAAVISRGTVAGGGGDLGKPVGENDLFDLTGNTGTLRYMAPEVALGCPYGVKCDVHSLAIVMYEVLSLVKPYVYVRPFSFTSVVVKGGLRPTLDPSWPPNLKDLLQRMWASDCATRPSAGQIVEALEGMLRGTEADLYPRSRGLRGLFADEEPPNRVQGIAG